MKQRGFSLIEVAIYAGIAIAVLAALAGLVHVWNNYTDSLDKKGYDRGVQVTRADYTQRDNVQLQAVIAERDRLLAEKEAKEKEHADLLAAKEADSAKKLAQKDADYDGFIADINAGRVVWRRPGEAGACAAVGGQGGAAQAAGGPGAGAGYVGGGTVPAQDPDALFLLSEAKRADRVLEKLSLCRDTLAIERK